ncbi:MAG: leucine-rich repeat domain-containing protein [Bacteroidaceae bacterium]|nr:leucine-rich repeat domain-containing protein [Bacteroidaceae bacterium]
MKQLRTVLAALLLLCSTVATAHDFEIDGIYYNILSLEEKTVEVTFEGDRPLGEYRGNVRIPASVTYKGRTYSVTTIGDNAFSNCFMDLTGIEIPNSVTTIGNDAFSGCSSLTSITIPNSVTTIGSNAFSSCSSLTGIEIPNSVTTIVSNAFSSCSSLTSISVAAGNTTYDSRDNCNAIIETATNTLIAGCKNTVIPSSVTTIGSDAFRGSGLTSIEIPNSVTTIGNSAFSSCRSLTSIEIPNSVTTIGKSAFSSCTSLTNIEIPNSVTTIGDYAFNYCTSLTNIEIPNSITTIGNSAFTYCSSLTSVKIPNSVTTIGESAFKYCEGLTSIEIPNSVTTIGNSAFYECWSLTSITIPSSVTTIGDYTFYYCSNLTSITSLIPADKLFVPGNNTFSYVPTNCTLYVPYGAKETYAATNGWNKFTNIVEFSVFDLTVSAAKYATLYLDYNAIIPQGVEVYTASTVDGNYLMMQEVTGTLPANTGVIVRAEQGTYTFERSSEAPSAITGNLFRGSVEDVYITPANEARYYVLSMKDGVVGMYEDALSGGTFKNNANKAYLVLGDKSLGIYDEEVDTEDPGMQLSNKYYFDFGGTTAIDPVVTEVNDNIYYDLSGRRVENPTRGIYIVNGKKRLIK